jgi:hypothetical protein
MSRSRRRDTMHMAAHFSVNREDLPRSVKSLYKLRHSRSSGL